MLPYVNAHTHLELTALHNRLTAGLPFTQWILELIMLRRTIAEAEIVAGIERGIELMQQSGTVAVGDISATGLSIAPLMQSGLAGVVYLEVLGLEPVGALERLAATQRRITELRRGEGRMRIGLSVHAPYSSCAPLFQAATGWCIAEDVPLCIHIAESPAERQWLWDGSGPFGEYRAQLAPSAPPWNAPRLSPVAYLHALGVLAARPLLIHGVEVDEVDLALLAAANCAVVHCPRSNTQLGCDRMPLERYLARGITVALGTDSLASSPSLDLGEELAAAQARHGERVAAAEWERIATVNGWRALGLPAQS